MDGPHSMSLTHYLVMVLFWLLIVGGAVGLLAALFPAGKRKRGPAAGQGGSEPPGPALAALQERYARGEITRQQYEEVCRQLAQRLP